MLLKIYASKLERDWIQEGTFTTNPTPRGLETLIAPLKELDGGHYLFLELQDNLERQSVLEWIVHENGMTCIVTPFGMKIGWILQSVSKIYKILQNPPKQLPTFMEDHQE